MVDLDFAQIFGEERSQYDVNHCFLSTLKYFGVAPAHLVDIARRYQNFALHIPRSVIQATCDRLKITIHLTSYRDESERGALKAVYEPKDGESSKTLHCGLYHDHIFPDVPTVYSRFYLRNLVKIKESIARGETTKTKALEAFQWNRGKLRFSSESKGLCSSAVIAQLFNDGQFDKVASHNIIRLKANDEVVQDPVIEDSNQRRWQLVRDDKKKNKKKKNKEEPEESEEEEEEEEEESVEDVDEGKAPELKAQNNLYFAADLEAFVQSDHTVCMGAYMQVHPGCALEEDPEQVKLFDRGDIIQDMFSSLMDDVREQEVGKTKFNIHVFFHNLKYDRTLIESCPTMRIVKICEKDNAIYSLKVRFEGRVITIRDSLKLIPISISKFPNTFSLPPSLKKQDEFIIYRYFSEDNAHDEFTCTPIQYVHQHTFDGDESKNDQLREQYIAKLTSYLHALWQDDSSIRCSGACCDEEHFHPWLMYKDYLRYDVLVLAAGLVVFQREFSQVTNNRMDPLETLTISSYAFKYMGLLGAYDGAYEMCDTFRAFQGKAVYGGRVFCNPLYEGKCVTDCKLKYMDACSL